MPAFPLYSFAITAFLLALSLPSFAAPVHTISAEQKNLRPGVTRIEVPQTIGGKTIRREVLIHAPRSRDTSKRYPILFALHGNGGRHSNFLRPLQPFVEQGAFVGIYPQGYRRSWNLGEEKSTADDVAFINMILKELASYPQLDTEKAFVMGVSNGAGMAHQLAIETDHFLAIAAIVSHLNALSLPGDRTSELSVLQISGDQDRIIPYEGGDSPTGHLFLPAEVSSRIWARHNGIEGRPEIMETADGNQRLSYRGGRKGTEVLHYRMRDHGHGGFEGEEGGINRLIWKFFQQQMPRGSE